MEHKIERFRRHTLISGPVRTILTVACILVARADVSPQDRAVIDRAIGAKGVFVPDDGVYKVVLPREAATIFQDYQTLSPNLGLNSWAGFNSAIHKDAIMSGQFLLLDDEVNPVISVALDAGLDITGLAAVAIFEGPRLYTLDVSGRGTFQALAASFRKGLDEVRRVRRAGTSRPSRPARPAVPQENAIDSQPLDAILSMRGTVVNGVYRGALGKRTMMWGEVLGREMGFTSWISFAGMNDHAVVQGELVETPDDLPKVLRALRTKGINVESIRNHTFGEHPQYLFIRFWAKGAAVELARSIRSVLDVDFGAIPPPGVKM